MVLFLGVASGAQSENSGRLTAFSPQVSAIRAVLLQARLIARSAQAKLGMQKYVVFIYLF